MSGGDWQADLFRRELEQRAEDIAAGRLDVAQEQQEFETRASRRIERSHAIQKPVYTCDGNFEF
jgi:hypothetical protein